ERRRGAEGKPEPRLDEVRKRRHEDELPGPSLLDPAPRRGRVQVAHELAGLPHRMAGELDPEIAAEPILPAAADQVADHLAVRDGGATARPLGLPVPLDLSAEVRDVREQRLGAAMPRVALGEHGRGAVDVLVGEGDDLWPAHGRRLAEMSPKTLAGEELQL